MKQSTPRGVATIPIILTFGILIIAISVGVTATSFSETITAQSSYQSGRALLYAEAGARDALLRIARDKNYACTASDCYSVPLAADGCSDNSACARVSVSSGAGTVGDPKVVVSKGQAGINVRTLQVSVVLDANQFGQIATTTWQERSR
jgi:hypothetical protein